MNTLICWTCANWCGIDPVIRIGIICDDNYHVDGKVIPMETIAQCRCCICARFIEREPEDHPGKRVYVIHHCSKDDISKVEQLYADAVWDKNK